MTDGSHPPPPGMHIVDLCTLPQHVPAAAALIHNEFWTTVQGASVAGMAARLREAAAPGRVPLALVALQGDLLLGAVNLVADDSDTRPQWTPWLAGMVVATPWRGKGIGSALVQALLQRAWRIGCEQVFLGSDGPGFYTRLGATVLEQPRPGFWYLHFTRPAQTA